MARELGRSAGCPSEAHRATITQHHRFTDLGYHSIGAAAGYDHIIAGSCTDSVVSEVLRIQGNDGSDDPIGSEVHHTLISNDDVVATGRGDHVRSVSTQNVGSATRGSDRIVAAGDIDGGETGHP